LSELQDRYHDRVRRKALQLAKSFLKMKFDEMRYKAMKCNAYQMKFMTRKDWFRKSWMPLGSGGFLEISKDEALGDGLEKSVEDLKDQLALYVDDIDIAILAFWQEAFSV
jgi:hypothetical protein